MIFFCHVEKEKNVGVGGSRIRDRDLHSVEYCLGFVGFIVRASLKYRGGHISQGLGMGEGGLGRE